MLVFEKVANFGDTKDAKMFLEQICTLIVEGRARLESQRGDGVVIGRTGLTGDGFRVVRLFPPRIAKLFADPEITKNAITKRLSTICVRASNGNTLRSTRVDGRMVFCLIVPAGLWNGACAKVGLPY